VTHLEIPTDWTFKNRAVADAFDSHVREQLPWYELAAGATAHVARHYISREGLVYDIGASTGNIGNLLRETLEARQADLIAIDDSDQMADIYLGPGSMLVADALAVDYQPCDVAVLFLVVMFLPVYEREAFLARLYGALKPGGALLVVDKSDESCGYLATILRRLTLAGKVATGTSSDDIIAKELSLMGVQRPLSEQHLPGDPQVFFRFGEFTGWVIEK
jgi:tRNA (cmo5U34)-methyltransferase